MLAKLLSIESPDLGKFLWTTFLTGLVAFLIAGVLVCAADTGALGGTAWMRDFNFHVLLFGRWLEFPVARVVHVLLVELSFLAVLALSLVVASRELVDRRVIQFVLLSFFVFDTYALLFFSYWWQYLCWDMHSAYLTAMAFSLPVPGAFNYGARLALGAGVTGARGIAGWDRLPWWSVLLPTISFAMVVAAAGATEYFLR